MDGYVKNKTEAIRSVRKIILWKYLPTFLMDGNALIYDLKETKDYLSSLIIAAAVSIICFVISIPVFNKKQL